MNNACFPGGKFTHPCPHTRLTPAIQAASRLASPAASSLLPDRTLASTLPYKRPVSLLPWRQVHSSLTAHLPWPCHTLPAACFPGGKFTPPRPLLNTRANQQHLPCRMLFLQPLVTHNLPPLDEQSVGEHNISCWTRVLLTGTVVAEGQIQGHGNLEQIDITYATPD